MSSGGYEFFDLSLSSLIQQKTAMIRETFLLNLTIMEFRRTILNQIGRELRHYHENKARIAYERGQINSAKSRLCNLSESTWCVAKRRIKKIAGAEASLILAKICHGIKKYFQIKRLNNSIKRHKQSLSRLTYAGSPYTAGAFKEIQTMYIKEEVAEMGVMCITHEYNKRLEELRDIHSNELTCGVCVSCETDGQVIKISCGDTYHIECINAIVITDLLESGTHAACTKCGKTFSY